MSQSQQMLVQFGSMIAVMGILWFLMIRPQQKKAKESMQMRENLSIGDEITTIGGIVGTITRLDGDKINISTGNQEITILKRAVSFKNNEEDSHKK